MDERLKAAGQYAMPFISRHKVSTHSRPKAAGTSCAALPGGCTCFNTQPPEGGWSACSWLPAGDTGFNTQPPEGGWGNRFEQSAIGFLFQHTAARRRLECASPANTAAAPVSTHSRPKAAGELQKHKSTMLEFQHTAARRRLGRWPTTRCWIWCFNTQPPEGGWPAQRHPRRS